MEAFSNSIASLTTAHSANRSASPASPSPSLAVHAAPLPVPGGWQSARPCDRSSALLQYSRSMNQWLLRLDFGGQDEECFPCLIDGYEASPRAHNHSTLGCMAKTLVNMVNPPVKPLENEAIEIGDQ